MSVFLTSVDMLVFPVLAVFRDAGRRSKCHAGIPHLHGLCKVQQRNAGKFPGIEHDPNVTAHQDTHTYTWSHVDNPGIR